MGQGAGDDETRTFITQTYQRAEAFLFGGGPTSCSPAPGDQSTRCAHIPSACLERGPKYVASTTLTAPRWEDTTVLRGDLAAAISELKPSRGVSCRCTAVAP